MKDTFGIEPTLVKGSVGMFDVIVDEKLIFSKQAVGRFPSEDEIVAALRAH